VEVVINAGQSGLDRRWFGLALRRVGFSAQGFVFVDADNDPAWAGRSG
jgi:hypothetical protein